MRDYGQRTLEISDEQDTLFESAKQAGFLWGAGGNQGLPKLWDGHRISKSSTLVSYYFRQGRDAGRSAKA